MCGFGRPLDEERHRLDRGLSEPARDAETLPSKRLARRGLARPVGGSEDLQPGAARACGDTLDIAGRYGPVDQPWFREASYIDLKSVRGLRRVGRNDFEIALPSERQQRV